MTLPVTRVAVLCAPVGAAAHARRQRRGGLRCRPEPDTDLLLRRRHLLQWLQDRARLRGARAAVAADGARGAGAGLAARAEGLKAVPVEAAGSGGCGVWPRRAVAWAACSGARGRAAAGGGAGDGVGENDPCADARGDGGVGAAGAAGGAELRKARRDSGLGEEVQRRLGPVDRGVNEVALSVAVVLGLRGTPAGRELVGRGVVLALHAHRERTGNYVPPKSTTRAYLNGCDSRPYYSVHGTGR